MSWKDPNNIDIRGTDELGNSVPIKVDPDGNILVVSTDAQLETSPLPRNKIVQNTATRLDDTPLIDRKSILITNNTPNSDLFVGDVNVTTTNGTPLGFRDRIELDLVTSAGIYAITDGTLIDVRLLELK